MSEWSWSCVVFGSTQGVDMIVSANGLEDLYQVYVEYSSKKWIGSCFCFEWRHMKCAYLSGNYQDDIPKRNWICTPCLREASLDITIVKKNLGKFKQELSIEICG